MYLSSYSTNPDELLIPYKESQNLPGEATLLNGIEMVKDAINFVSSIAFNCDAYIAQPKVFLPPDAKPLNDNHLKTNKKLRNLLNDVIIHIEMLGLFGGSRACLAHIIQLERIRKKADDSQSRMILTALITTLTTVR